MFPIYFPLFHKIINGTNRNNFSFDFVSQSFLQCVESREIISIERRLCIISWSSRELRRFIVLSVQHCRTHICQSTQQKAQPPWLSSPSSSGRWPAAVLQDAAVRWLWLNLQQWHLLLDPLSLWPVGPAKLLSEILVGILYSGINRNLDRLQSS